MGRVGFFSVWVLVFVIPWENMIVVPGVGTFSRLVGIGALILGVISVLLRKCPIRFHKFHWVLLAYILWGGYTYFWSIAPTQSMIRILTYSQIFVMTWLIFQAGDSVEAVEKFMAAYVIGAYVSLITIFCTFATHSGDAWQRYSAQGFNPNDIAIILALGIPLAWYLANLRHGFLAWFFGFYPFIAFIGIVLTASRNGFLAASLTFSYLLFTTLRHSLRRLAIFCTAVATAVVAGFYVIPPASMARVATFGASLGGDLNGRVEYWKIGLKAFAKHPLVGWGVASFQTVTANSIGIPAAPHNVYLSVLVEQGFLGFLLFLLVLALSYFSLAKMPIRERLCWLAVLGTWSICAFALNWEWRKQTWLILVLLVTHASALSPRSNSVKQERSVGLIGRTNPF